MIDVKNKKCLHEGCASSPSFNKKGLITAIYCAKHKEIGMIDVKNKKCLHEGCASSPSFNKKGLITAIYCAKHKEIGMVNIVTKRCIHPLCEKLPSFNKEGLITPIYCAKHKEIGMVNIVTKKCMHPLCKKSPLFNTPGESVALYCSKHKEIDMIDVKNKKCLELCCMKTPSFNNDGETIPLYCTQHKKKGMINVRDKPCIHPSCKTIPTFNNEGETIALYCTQHKKEGMINVKDIGLQCKTVLCSTLVTKKYEGYCLVCFMNLYPDRPIARNYKTKEFAVVDYIKKTFPDQNWIADKIINGGFSRRRPDLILHLKNHVIIIEVDENKHNTYECICENKRIMLISQDVEHKPIVMLRFNPDKYKTNKEVVKSCWELNKNGICVIAKSKKEEWAHRLKVLEEQVIYWMGHETTKTLEIIELFY